MQAIAVFSGSSSGLDPAFQECAFQLGQHLGAARITLIYGGAKVGLMGAVADGALSCGGRVVGVLPEFLLRKELAHEGLSELILVSSMHERKQRMHELSDGVVALPGGFGTLEEYFEMLTWAQLGLHRKPIGLLNFKGFYDGLLLLADTMVRSGLLRSSHRQMMLTADSAPQLLEAMREYVAPTVPKWLKSAQS